MVMTAGAAPQITVTQTQNGDTRSNERAGLMKRAYQFYVGQPPRPLRKRSGEPDDNVLLSLGRSLVDTGVAYLFGEDVVSKVTEKGSEQAQDWLDEAWRRNKKLLTLQKLATNGGICGHAFVKVIPDGIRAGGITYPRVVVLDPQQIAVVTDDDDCDHVLEYVINYPASPSSEGLMEASSRRQVVQEGRQGDSWTILDQHFVAGAWVTDMITPWAYDWAPIVDCQNLPRPNDFWGESDLPDDICSLLQVINRVASHHNKIIRVHAHPKVWSRGMGTRTLDTAIDSIIQMPSEHAELRILEMQSDLRATRDFLLELKDNLALVTRTPLVALGEPDKLGTISGVALQIRFRPLVQKTEAKRRTYGDLLQELERRMLEVAGFGGAHITHQDWPELLPNDPLAERQTLVIDDSLGVVSRETLASKLGYDWETEQQQLAEERAAAPVAPVLTQPPAGAGPVDPAQPVPPPAALQAPKPDIATRAVSR